MQLSCVNFVKDFMRSTKIKNAIHEVFVESKKPLTVNDLKKALSQKQIHPHKTSIYRNLEKMCSDGVIEEVMLDASVMHYELQERHHHHAFCQKCNTALCVTDRCLEKNIHHIIQKVAREGFSVTDHQISFVGLCKLCK